MTVSPDSLAQLAGLLADRTRASFCLALLDGRAWTVGELARHAGIGLPTASEQLSRLVNAGLLVEERQGRHRYLRLADRQVAKMIEDLAQNADPASRTGFVGQTDPLRPSGLRVVKVSAALSAGRTCYDHLAGRLGVSIADALAVQQMINLEDGVSLTPSGAKWLTELEIDVAALRSARRPLIRTCLDWTERRPHLAGAVGAAIQQAFLARAWIAPGHTPRVITLTSSGRLELPLLLGVDPTTLEPAT